MNTLHKRRLLKCAQIVAKARRYDQSSYCGTSHCALSHYDSAVDRQDSPQEHFGLSIFSEYLELFGAHGCGEAKTGKEAAAYIRAFVKRKEK